MDNLLNFIVQALPIRQGITIDRNLTEPINGYAVARKGSEFVLEDYSQRSVNVLLHYVQVYVNNQYIAATGSYYGFWVDTDIDQLFMDVVDIVHDRDMAISLGELNDQIAIFDITNKEEIRLS